MDLTYLDSNATTQPAPEVVAAMTQCLTDTWGNPSSAHRFGQEARRKIDEAREQVAALVNCTPRELTFLSGGTEATNTRSAACSRRGRRGAKSSPAKSNIRPPRKRAACSRARVTKSSKSPSTVPANWTSTSFSSTSPTTPRS